MISISSVFRKHRHGVPPILLIPRATGGNPRRPYAGGRRGFFFALIPAVCLAVAGSGLSPDKGAAAVSMENGKQTVLRSAPPAEIAGQNNTGVQSNTDRQGQEGSPLSPSSPPPFSREGEEGAGAEIMRSSPRPTEQISPDDGSVMPYINVTPPWYGNGRDDLRTPGFHRPSRPGYSGLRPPGFHPPGRPGYSGLRPPVGHFPPAGLPPHNQYRPGSSSGHVPPGFLPPGGRPPLGAYRPGLAPPLRLPQAPGYPAAPPPGGLSQPRGLP